MRDSLLLLGFVCFVSLAYAQKRELPVKIVDATKQSWVSGAPGGKTGTKYSVKVYINTPKKVEFKNMWIGKENVLFDTEFFSLDIPKKIQNGDSLLLTYNKINGDKGEKTDAKRLPIQCKGGALIETTVDGKARYFVVGSFKTIGPLRGQ